MDVGDTGRCGEVWGDMVTCEEMRTLDAEGDQRDEGDDGVEGCAEEGGEPKASASGEGDDC